jgi:hypothetical protein
MIIATGIPLNFEMDYYRHSIGSMYLIFSIELDFKACLHEATLFGAQMVAFPQS